MIKDNKIKKLTIKKYCKDNKINLSDKIIICLSGGVDSTSLFFLLNSVFKKKNIHVLIFDHGVRKESEAEIKKISELYKLKKKYPHKIFRISNKIIKSNFQNSSREVRLDLIFKYSKKNSIKHIFLGHHYDDYLETFFLRKIQISGIDGLINIFSKKFKEFYIHRPLKYFYKKEIIFFSKTNNQTWFEDQTNKKNLYSRNKVRNHLKVNKNKNLLENYMKKLVPINRLILYFESLIETKNNILLVNRTFLLNLPLSLQKYFIFRLLTRLNESSKLRPENISNIVKHLSKNITINKKISIKGGFMHISDVYLKFIPYNPL